MGVEISQHNYSRYRSGCRCDTCRTDASRYDMVMRHRHREMLKTDPALARHGTLTAYVKWMCRCNECYLLHSDYQKAKRMRAGGVITERRNRYRAVPFGREWLNV